MKSIKHKRIRSCRLSMCCFSAPNPPSFARFCELGLAKYHVNRGHQRDTASCSPQEDPSLQALALHVCSSAGESRRQLGRVPAVPWATLSSLSAASAAQLWPYLLESLFPPAGFMFPRYPQLLWRRLTPSLALSSFGVPSPQPRGNGWHTPFTLVSS